MTDRPMEYTTLGRTGLRTGVAGLGCGGFSRLGQAHGKSKAESVALVRMALDMGVNLLDTAEAYGTEGIVGEAIRGLDRDQVVLSTKTQINRGPDLKSPDEIVTSQIGRAHV